MGNFRCITDRIFSRSSLETPMLSSACRMPQSGQMGVWLSVLESAGTPEYSFPQSGQIAETGLSVFMVVHLLFADVHGFPQVFQVKTELAVSVHTGANIGRSGNAQFPFLVHDIHKGSQLFSGFCKRKFQFRFVVEMGIPLIAVEGKFISSDTDQTAAGTVQPRLGSMVR